VLAVCVANIESENATMIEPDIIACADLHLRTDVPRCRTDDFICAQWEKVAFLRVLKREFPHALVTCSGDLFDYWNDGAASPKLIAEVITRLPDMLAIPGQHDLPHHSLENYKDSSLYALQCGRSNVVVSLGNGHPITHGDVDFHCCPFGVNPKQVQRAKKPRMNVLLWHKYVWSGNKPIPTATDESKGHAILNRFPGYDLIITGDNHIPFHCCSDDGRMLINCGSMMRTTTIQKDYKPAVWLIQLDPLKAEKRYYPIKAGVVSTEHLDSVLKTGILEEFIQEVGKGVMTPLDFVANVMRYAQTHKLADGVELQLLRILDQARETK